MSEGWREFLIIIGLGVVVFLFMRRGGNPAQQESGQVPTDQGAPVNYGPYYLSYNEPKGNLPTVSNPALMQRGAANGNLPVCTACDEQILFGTQGDFANYLQNQLTGVWLAYKANILAMTPDFIRQYL